MQTQESAITLQRMIPAPFFARLAGIHPKTAARGIANGKIPASTLGPRRKMIPVAAAAALLHMTETELLAMFDASGNRRRN